MNGLLYCCLLICGFDQPAVKEENKEIRVLDALPGFLQRLNDSDPKKRAKVADDLWHALRKEWPYRDEEYPERASRANLRRISAGLLPIVARLGELLALPREKTSEEIHDIQAGGMLWSICREMPGTAAARASAHQLAAKLTHPNKDVRLAAADGLRGIAKIDVCAVARDLRQALKSADKDTRYPIAFALAKLGEPSPDLTALILETIATHDDHMQYEAFKALEDYPAPAKDTLPVLLPLLKVKDAKKESGWYQALAILPRYGGDAREAIPLVTALLGNSQTHGEAAECLSRFGPLAKDAIPLILEMLPKDLDLRNDGGKIENACRRFGKLAVPSLLNALKSKDENAAAIAFSAIRYLEDANEAVPTLIAWAQGSNEKLKEVSRHLLSAWAVPPRATHEAHLIEDDAFYRRADLPGFIKADSKVLAKWLKSDSKMLQDLAWQRWHQLGDTDPGRLAVLGDRQAVAALARWLHEGHGKSLDSGIKITEEDFFHVLLAETDGHEKEVIEHFRKRLQQVDPDVCHTVSHILMTAAYRELAKEHRPRDPAALRQRPLFKEARSLLTLVTRRMNETLDQKTINLHKFADEFVVLEAIGPGGDQVPTLLRLLERQAKVTQEADFGDKLETEIRRVNTAGLLAECGPMAKQAVPRLVKLIEYGDWRLTPSLARIDPDAARALIPTLLKKPSRILADLADFPTLMKMGVEFEYINYPLTQAFELAKFDDRVAVVLTRYIVKTGKLDWLTKIPSQVKHVVPAVARKLRDEDHVDVALSILAQIGKDAKPAVPELKKLLANPDPKLQLRAAILLANLDPSVKDGIPFLIDELQAAEPLLLHVHITEEERVHVETVGEMFHQLDATEGLGKIPDSDLLHYRRYLIRKLAKVGAGNDAVITALRPLLQNPALRPAVEEALKEVCSHP